MILACVFAPFTFIAFVFVGMFAAVPFAIYNAIVVRRSNTTPGNAMEDTSCKNNILAVPASHGKSHPEKNRPETTINEYFVSINVINRDTYKKLKWHFVSKGENLLLVAGLLLGIMAAIRGIAEQQYMPMAFGIFCALLIATNLVVKPERIIKINLQRAQETTGQTDLEIITSFTDEKIKLHNITTGNTTYLGYDAIKRIVETKDMYILFSKANQFVLVDKTTLIQQQNTEDFKQFLRDKCKHVSI